MECEIDGLWEDIDEALLLVMGIRNQARMLRDRADGDDRTMLRRVAKQLDNACGALSLACDEMQ